MGKLCPICNPELMTREEFNALPIEHQAEWTNAMANRILNELDKEETDVPL